MVRNESAVVVLVSKEDLMILKKLCKTLNKDLETLLHEALSLGIKKLRLEKAIELYVNGKASLWGAAELAGLDYRSFEEELRRRNIKFRYPGDDF